tara:strand:- start:3303 stop:3554 length:252 start_codon:yes stop_codon:yes gene_type:complete
MATVNGKKEKIFNTDFDPDDRIKMTTDVEGYPTVTIDGKPATPFDHVDAIQENVERHNKGMAPRSIRSFNGFGKGTLRKPYKN